jgi:hypothetical protein
MVVHGGEDPLLLDRSFPQGAKIVVVEAALAGHLCSPGYMVISENYGNVSIEVYLGAYVILSTTSSRRGQFAPNNSQWIHTGVAVTASGGWGQLLLHRRTLTLAR